MERVDLRAHAGLAHASAVTGGLIILSHTLLLSTARILIVSVSEGPCEEEMDGIYNMLGTWYVQYSSIKSHLRTDSMPKWKSSGVWKGFPTWSRSCLKMVHVCSIHSSLGGGIGGGFPTPGLSISTL